VAPGAPMASSKPLAILIALVASAAQAQDVPPIIPPPKPEVAAAVPPCQPQSLVSMTVRNITPGLQAADHRAQPRRIWRKGGRHLRTVEQPVVAASVQDPKEPMARQALFLVSEPDVWMIDLASRTGGHTLDKGPVYEVRAPILPAGSPPQFMALEYGCEAEFVAVRAPVAQRTIRWGAVAAGIHTYTLGTHSLAILMDDRSGEPFMITYVRDGRPAYIIRYDEYRRGLPDDPELFRPPADVKITETEALPPGSRPLD